jgi:hypothetical protein
MKSVYYGLLFIMISIFAVMLNRAYIVVSVSSWNEGCSEAALKLGKDYGQEYRTYMERFCNTRREQIEQAFKIGVN